MREWRRRVVRDMVFLGFKRNEERVNQKWILIARE